MIKKFVLICIVLCVFTMIFNTSCKAQTYASDYAPVFYFESKETCYPINAEFQLEWSDLYVVGTPVPISTDPSASDLSLYGSEYYLDNQEGTPESYSKIISDSQSYEETNGNTVYYRTYTDSVSGATVIQYWMFYAFNDGEMNKHEADWEMVQVVLEGGEPSWVAYSQHHGGQWASWNQVEKDGNHIKVYVARGSHANYLRPYSGKLGISNDIVGANGKILNPGDYSLQDLDTQDWIDYRGRWGECGADATKFASYEALGNNGPEGPKYREAGAMWDNPVSWGKSTTQANDMFFTAEWFVYNFVLIMVLITLASLCLTFFFIYRRHKKYGLGPRIVSMLYIDGLNLKSIGNILCVVGIVIAIVGLFNTWYSVSMDLSETSQYTGIQVSGMQDLILIHGMDGVRMSIPTTTGFKSIATLSIPFGLFLIIGLIFLIIATIGISQSKKLGKKYIWRGIRLLIPFILILIIFMAIGSIIPQDIGGDSATSAISDIVKSITSSPFGSQTTIYVSQSGISVPIGIKWGLGIGATLLLVAGIIIIISGIFEIIANKQFFVTKIPEGKAISKMQIPPPVVQSKPSGNFCIECGAQLKDNAMFCTHCGKKLK